MNQYSTWRYVFLVILIVLGIVYALPNLYGEDPAVQISNKNGMVIDNQVVTQLEQSLNDQHIAYLSAQLEGKSLLIRFKDTESQLRAQDIVQATVGSDYSVALNLAPKTPAWLQAIGAEPMKLGLDLRGGIHFLLNVDVDAMLSTRESSDVHGMGQALRDEKIRYTRIHEEGSRGILIYFSDLQARDQAKSLLRNRFPEYTYSDAKFDAGPAIQAVISPQELAQLETYAVEQNIATLRNRVNELGIAEPVIQRQGATQISVDLPGIQDTARAKDIIGKVATVRLQLVDIEHDAQAAKQNRTVPFGDTLYEYENQPILLKNSVVLSGTSIINASATTCEDGRACVQVRIGGSGQSSFNQITAENIGKPMSVIYVETQSDKKMVNNKVVTSHHQIETVINVATIQSALGNNFQITGLDSLQYAQNLALLLRSGAYSAPVDFVQERVVGPSLGKENIRMGVMSTLMGSLAVILFMALYYRIFGLFANMALILNVVFIVAILSVLGATLTLPAIAGIVLTVGMAVDANVLINERIREELRNGLSPQASIYAGYERAFSTIVDANVSTLIVAVVLFALGSGSVQGFAVTLIIGLLTSMVTAIFFTRAIVNLTYGRRQIKTLSIGIRLINKHSWSEV